MFGYKNILNHLDEIRTSLAPTAGPIGIIEAYAKLEGELGISGLMDFINAPPSAFPTPKSNGQHLVYLKNTRELQARVIPAWGDLCRRLVHMATPETTYLALVTRWPHWQKHWETAGLNFVKHGPASQDVLVLAHQYGNRADLAPSASTFKHLRGSFKYDGNYGVFVVAVPSHEAFDLFHVNYNVPCFKNGELVFPPERVIGLTDGPTERERELLNQVIRAYWKRLRDQYDYRARRKTYETWEIRDRNAANGQNPLTDDIPAILELPGKVSGPGLPREVELWDEFSASGLLESWHVAAKVARIIQRHREKTVPVEPKLAAPADHGCGIQLV
ncbi:MAG: hypothetical protein Q7S36_00605 [Candidatus Liptonbacteria bacterium]|nr:hypothetical protein [Candidatus Liptonbacteria bacterium]